MAKRAKNKFPALPSGFEETPSGDFPDVEGFEVVEPTHEELWEMGGLDKKIESTIKSSDDIATAMAASATLEHADEILEFTLGKKFATRFRKRLKQARKDSPYATMLADVITPDAMTLLTGGISKLGKADKIKTLIGKVEKVFNPEDLQKLDKFVTTGGETLKGASKGAVNAASGDVISQQGEDPDKDLDLMRTAGSTILGTTVGGTLGSMKNVNRHRADSLGLNSDPSDLAHRTSGDILKVDEYTSEILDTMEDLKLYDSKVKWDSDADAFKSSGKSFIPPSDRELLARIGEAKSQLAKKIRGVVKANSSDVPIPTNLEELDDFRDAASRLSKNKNSGNPIPMVEDIKKSQKLRDIQTSFIAPSDPSIFSKSDFQEDIADFLNDSGFSDKVRKRAEDILDDVMDTNFGKDGEIYLPLEKIHDLRSAMDRQVKWDRGAMDADAGIREQATKTLANIFRTKVRDKLKDTPFEDWNSKYMKLSDADAAASHKLGVPPPSYVSKAVGSTSNTIKGLAAAESVMTLPRKFPAQVYSKGQETDIVSDFLGLKDFIPSDINTRRERATRKIVPAVLRPDQEVEEERGVNRMPNSMPTDINIPRDLIRKRLPRTSEAIRSKPDLFRAKYAQNAENVARRRMISAGYTDEEITPEQLQDIAAEMYKNVDVVLKDSNSSGVDKMLPMWINEAPELFEDDNFQRINGQVKESLKPEARRSILNSDLPNTEKYAKVSKLNKFGIMEA